SLFIIGKFKAPKLSPFISSPVFDLKSLNNNKIIPILESGRSTYPDFMNKAINRATGDLLVQWNDDAFMADGGWQALKNRATKWKEAAGFRFPYANVRKFPPDHAKFMRPSWMSFGCYRRSTLEFCGTYHPEIHFYHCDTELCKRVQILKGMRSLPYLDACKVYHLNNTSGRTRTKQDRQGKRDASKCKSVCQQTRNRREIPSGVSVLPSA
ncbi:hypothetical protein LCGC14_2899020, partial [marine sediment metagenome]